MRNDQYPWWNDTDDDSLVTIGPQSSDWPDVSDDDTDAPLDPPSAEETPEQ